MEGMERFVRGCEGLRLRFLPRRRRRMYIGVVRAEQRRHTRVGGAPCTGRTPAVAGFVTATDIIGDARERFEAAEQLHARVEVIIDLTLVIAVLALALCEHHVGDGTGIQIGELAHVLFAHAVHAKACGGLVHDLVDQSVDLLAVVRRPAIMSAREPLPRAAVGVLTYLTVQLFGLGLPRHTTVLGNLPRRLLVDHGLLQPGQRRINLGDVIPALAQIEGHVLDVLLREMGILALVERMCTIQESVHLIGIVSPFALPNASDPRCAFICPVLMRHWCIDLLRIVLLLHTLREC